MEFLNLPLELLTQILSHLAQPKHLAYACRVSKTFHEFGVSRLYERASIYSWHKHAKARVVSLFNTLAHYPHLAKHVLKLEIRDFPKSVAADELGELVVKGLRNCVSLRACTWTRDGALNSAVLAVLQASDTLLELEINGHSDGHYDAALLRGFAHLRRVSLIMPSADVVRQLQPWMASTGAQLRNLTLICKMSPLVTDGVLEAIAPSLAQLEKFSITGCPRVSHLGIWALLAHNTAGLRVLGLEGHAVKFNIAALSAHCAGSNALARLQSFTLSIHTEAWLAAAAALVVPAPLEAIHLYATRAFTPTAAGDAFWQDLVSLHGARLTRVSVHRMSISLPAIADVCVRCPALQELFIVVDPSSLVRFVLATFHSSTNAERSAQGPLTDCLASARALTTVHVNFPSRQEDEFGPNLLTAPQALAIVHRCPDTIALFGCNARVWHVGRQIQRSETGELVAERFLAKYDSPDIPEQFLVVRT
ncbi:hypothetical protein C8F04DRAFT_1401610 [Mycena alexandri]|uniref:F-box domain-containing protein n=1 Tax=Mycena alexandri TaxID=1745969 RepID=A0AAD6SBD0_9AGAR|nr:hypothetical protein C8F04DRAFT_1401610 [Mycena alexandri]